MESWIGIHLLGYSASSPLYGAPPRPFISGPPNPPPQGFFRLYWPRSTSLVILSKINNLDIFTVAGILDRARDLAVDDHPVQPQPFLRGLRFSQKPDFFF